MPEPGQSFKAKYGGVCSLGCDAAIEVGDVMTWYSSQEVYHYDCRPRSKEDVKEPEKLGQDGFTFVDLETGGTDKVGHAIVQVAAIVTTPNLLIVDHYSSLIKPPPQLVITAKASEIHGHTKESLKNERSESKVLREFASWCAKYPNHRFAGYCCPFDLGFLDEGFQRCAIEERPYLLPPLDLLDRARTKLGKKTENHKLGTIASYFGFSAKDAHDALCDLFLTVQVARNLEAA